jgi:1-acyl-sn-glycerol-3-phosphate acyltransferase
MRYLSRLILKIWGWKVSGGIPPELKKCVVIVAPHTSMWDFVIGRMAWYVIGLKVKFLIKKEMFFFPVGFHFENNWGVFLWIASTKQEFG